MWVAVRGPGLSARRSTGLLGWIPGPTTLGVYRGLAWSTPTRGDWAGSGCDLGHMQEQMVALLAMMGARSLSVPGIVLVRATRLRMG